MGTGAIRLTNTLGAAPVQYIRGPISLMSNFTVSLWFNPQSAADGTNYQIIFSMFTKMVQIYLNSGATELYALVPSGASPNYILFGPVHVTLNTWYSVTLIYQSGGLCSFYVNNTLIRTLTSATPTGLSSTNFGIGYYDYAALNFPFNGYIDDVKIYNTAIPFSPMVFQNWSNVALSNTGQYMLATATGSGLFLSSNYGSTWSQVSSAMLQAAWTSAQVSATGQYMLASSQTVMVQPQLTGLTGDTTTATVVQTTWVQNGISWTSNASNTIFAVGYQPWVAFNNVGNASVTPYSWASLSSYPTPTSITTISSPGPGNYTGEWLQIYSSVPLVMYSYNFACGGLNLNFPKEYFIVGSRDNSTWFPIQSVILSSNPFTANFVIATSPAIIVNSSASQTINGGAAVSFTPTIYTTTSHSYNYFRIIAKTNFGGPNFELNEWYVNFTPLSSISATITYPSTTVSLSESGQYALTAIAPPLIAQLNFEGTFADSTGGNTITAPTSGGTGSGVTLSSVQAKVGTQSLFVPNVAGASTPLSYEVYTLSSFFNGAPTYTISTWIYPTALPASSDSVIYMLTNSTGNVCAYPYINSVGNVGIAFYTTSGILSYGGLSTRTISINTWSHIVVVFSSGTASLYINGILAITPITYTGTVCLYNNTGAPTRLQIGAGGFAYGGYAGYIDDLRIYNTALTSTQINTIYTIPLTTAVSGVAISPQQTRLTTSTWNQNGVAWTASASATYNGSTLAYNAFSNAYAIAWAGAPAAYSSSSPYAYTANTYSTTLSSPGPGAIGGDWLQIQSSVPLVISSYTFASSGVNQQPQTYYIAGSNDTILWYPIQYATGTVNPLTTTNTACLTYLSVSNSTIPVSQTIQGNVVGAYTTTGYSTSTGSYTYFRIIVTNTWGYTNGNTNIGQWFINFTTAPNTSLYNVVSPLTNFSTGSSVATGTIPGVITESAVSNTGQYMVIITNNTAGNNVYYSTNYGATFIGLQLGVLPMTSCSISYDGSYITVANATTVYQLNNTTSGYSLAIGNNTGVQNQGQNAIAIGNYAGYQNQTANSIILNATGAAVNAVAQGFYVAPIASYTASSSQTFSLLGYGIGTGGDNQVVQIAPILMSAAGNIGITGSMPRIQLIDATNNRQPSIEFIRGQTYFDNGPSYSNWRIVASGGQPDGTMPAIGAGTLGFYHNGGGLTGHTMVLTDDGRVGIGTTAPGYTLDVNGTLNSSYSALSGLQKAGGIFLLGDITAAQCQLSNIGNYQIGFNFNTTGTTGPSTTYTKRLAIEGDGSLTSYNRNYTYAAGTPTLTIAVSDILPTNVSSRTSLTATAIYIVSICGNYPNDQTPIRGVFLAILDSANINTISVTTLKATSVGLTTNGYGFTVTSTSANAQEVYINFLRLI
jgi:hypothetical protein